MQDRTLEALGEFVVDENATFLGAALLVGRSVAEDFDLPGTEALLVGLGARYDDRATPWAFLKEEGFGGRSPADVVAGSRLDLVLKTRSGLPIAVAALVAHLAEVSGQPAEGVNFPGHFLMRVGQVLIDPFQLVERSEAECLQSLPEDARAGNPFALAQPTDVLLRMFNNLKYHFVARSEFHRALEMVDCQMKILPEHPTLFFEQGEYWLRLGSVQGARLGFEQALLGADSAVSSMARQRLDDLGDQADTLH